MHLHLCLQECGATYISKLEGMFTDMDLSKDVMHHFIQHCGISANAVGAGAAAALSNSVVVGGIDTHIQVIFLLRQVFVYCKQCANLVDDCICYTVSVSVVVAAQVLTTGFRPTPAVHFTCPAESVANCFPPEIRSAQASFVSFYNNKYQGRRLTWSYSLDR